MKYLFLALLVVLSGCKSSTDDVDLDATMNNAMEACAKRLMLVEEVRYEIGRALVTCEDPVTQEYRVIKLRKVMKETTK